MVKKSKKQMSDMERNFPKFGNELAREHIITAIQLGKKRDYKEAAHELFDVTEILDYNYGGSGHGEKGYGEALKPVYRVSERILNSAIKNKGKNSADVKYFRRFHNIIKKTMDYNLEGPHLEDILSSVIGILGFAGALFFLSGNVTGNIISNMSQNSSNLLGAVFFIVGLAGTFFSLRNRRLIK